MKIALAMPSLIVYLRERWGAWCASRSFRRQMRTGRGPWVRVAPVIAAMALVAGCVGPRPDPQPAPTNAVPVWGLDHWDEKGEVLL
jgi:hypothetical protein